MVFNIKMFTHKAERKSVACHKTLNHVQHCSICPILQCQVYDKYLNTSLLDEDFLSDLIHSMLSCISKNDLIPFIYNEAKR